jgi:chromate reductase, NAD(P)H dehydrogenase (quinone)
MKNIVAIGASNSSKSINKTFAVYAAQKIENAHIQIADLIELELPLFSPDLQALKGIPDNAQIFRKLITHSDGIVLSLAEYNGMVTTAFKNLWDWTSRIDKDFWQKKPMLLLATSPGGRGAMSVLNTVKTLLPHFGGNVIADFSLPRFQQTFTPNGLKDEALNTELNNKIELFQKAL